MSPEQCARHEQVDDRSDIYSLGLMLYEMLAGAPPFVAEGLGELLHMHMNVPAAPLSDHNPAVGPALGAAVAKAIEKDPAARHASMKAFQEALVTAITVEQLRAPGSGVTLSSSRRTGPITAGTTTLSANAGALEQGTDPDVVVTPRRGRAGIVAPLAIVLGVAGAFTARALRPPGADPAPGPLTTGVPEPTGPGRTAEPPPEDRPLSRRPRKPARTTIDIATAPAQARLLDADDGHLLGTSRAWRVAEQPRVS